MHSEGSQQKEWRKFIQPEPVFHVCMATEGSTPSTRVSCDEWHVSLFVYGNLCVNRPSIYKAF